MNSIDHFLVTDGSHITHYNGSLPSSSVLQHREEGEKVVWNHDIYQEIAILPKCTRFEILIGRIKRLANYLRNPVKGADFSSLTEALRYLFSPLTPTYRTVYKRTQRPLKEIADEYAQVKTGKSFPDVLIYQPFIREGLTLSMKGLAILAERLCKKSNQSNLTVCDSLHIFREQLKAIGDSPMDARHAFVVPCHQYEVNPDPRAVVEQHMLSVLVEKKDGELHVCVLEPMVLHRINLDTVLKLKVGADESSSCRFDPEELVMAFARDACSYHHSVTFYYSTVRRQFGPNGGCSTFALRDAINFLKNPAFFQEIQLDTFDLGPFRAITTLPPAFMLSTQSIKKINDYIQSNPTFAEQKLGKRQLSLSEAVERHTYRELKMPPESLAKKTLNKYVDEHTAKYQELVLEAFKSRLGN